MSTNKPNSNKPTAPKRQRSTKPKPAETENNDVKETKPTSTRGKKTVNSSTPARKTTRARTKTSTTTKPVEAPVTEENPPSVQIPVTAETDSTTPSETPVEASKSSSEAEPVKETSETDIPIPVTTEAGPIQVISEAEINRNKEEKASTSAATTVKNETVTIREEITVPLKLQTAKFRSYAVSIFSTLFIGTLVWALGFCILLAALTGIKEFEIKDLGPVAVTSLLLFGGLILVSTCLMIYRTREHNRQLHLVLNLIRNQFNRRYGTSFDEQEIYDLVNDFRVPVNVDNSRAEVKLTTLRKGKDARLIDISTGKELSPTTTITL